MKFPRTPGLLITFCMLGWVSSASSQNAEPMNIVVYGGTGNFGSVILLEALARGHNVKGVSRSPDKYGEMFNLFDLEFEAVQGDITDVDSVREIVTGTDAVIISVHGAGPDEDPATSVANQSAENMIAVARELGDAAPRILQIGGGSTLYINEDRTQLFSLIPGAPTEGNRYAIMWGHHMALETYQAAEDVKWTVFTPPPGTTMGKRGVRTGTFETNNGYIDVDPNNFSLMQIGGLSQEDLAMAIVDEIEAGNYIGARFSATYQ